MHKNTFKLYIESLICWNNKIASSEFQHDSCIVQLATLGDTEYAYSYYLYIELISWHTWLM